MIYMRLRRKSCHKCIGVSCSRRSFAVAFGRHSSSPTLAAPLLPLALVKLCGQLLGSHESGPFPSQMCLNVAFLPVHRSKHSNCHPIATSIIGFPSRGRSRRIPCESYGPVAWFLAHPCTSHRGSPRIPRIYFTTELL